MKITLVSGSIRHGSTTVDFLEHIMHKLDMEHEAQLYSIGQLPMFHPDEDQSPNQKVQKWKARLHDSDVVIIATPEYIHNVPAVLKNALEWITSSGSLAQKKVICLTYTPHAPRGKYAMSSLLQTLQALDADIILQQELYHSDDPGEVAAIIMEII